MSKDLYFKMMLFIAILLILSFLFLLYDAELGEMLLGYVDFED